MLIWEVVLGRNYMYLCVKQFLEENTLFVRHLKQLQVSGRHFLGKQLHLQICETVHGRKSILPIWETILRRKCPWVPDWEVIFRTKRTHLYCMRDDSLKKMAPLLHWFGWRERLTSMQGLYAWRANSPILHLSSKWWQHAPKIGMYEVQIGLSDQPKRV